MKKRGRASTQVRTERAVVRVAGRRELEGRAGETLGDVLHRGGVALSTSCGGRGTCGTCRVRVTDGAARLEPPGSDERRLLGPKHLAADERLACRVALPSGTIEISLVLDSRAADKAALGGLDRRQSPIRLHPLELPQPTIADPGSDWTRFAAGLDHHRSAQPSAPELIAHLSMLIGEADDECRVALTDEGEVLGVLRPGQRALGAAFDLGTTTVAAYLVDLESGSLLGVGSAPNRQSQYGDDVMSRAGAARKAAGHLRDLVWASAFAALANAGLDDPHDLLDVVVVGNTVMHHLALGLPVARLVRAPYVPAVVESLVWAGGLIHSGLAPWSRVRFPPLVAGFVGSDALVGLMTACGGDMVPSHPGTDRPIREGPDAIFYIDIGTNAEMALIHGGEIWACSAAAGAAFEGARLRCGSPAGPGAVVRAWLDEGRVEVRTWDGSPPKTIAGTGALSLIASLRRQGALDERGLLIPGAFAPTVLTTVDGYRAVELFAGVVLTEADIGELLLARAAFAAGRELLLLEAGVDEGQLARSVVAGTLGNEAAPDDLQILGLVPRDVPVEAAGNAAGKGACLMLLDPAAAWSLTDAWAARLHHLELSADAKFADAFVKHLSFP